jgi:hypothetical protein
MKLFQVLSILFHKVHPDNVIFWVLVAARTAVKDGTMFWLNVIGIDAPCASSCMLFQVFEWGGMKVKSV